MARTRQDNMSKKEIEEEKKRRTAKATATNEPIKTVLGRNVGDVSLNTKKDDTKKTDTKKDDTKKDDIKKVTTKTVIGTSVNNPMDRILPDFSASAFVRENPYSKKRWDEAQKTLERVQGEKAFNQMNSRVQAGSAFERMRPAGAFAAGLENIRRAELEKAQEEDAKWRSFSKFGVNWNDYEKRQEEERKRSARRQIDTLNGKPAITPRNAVRNPFLDKSGKLINVDRDYQAIIDEARKTGNKDLERAAREARFEKLFSHRDEFGVWDDGDYTPTERADAWYGSDWQREKVVKEENQARAKETFEQRREEKRIKEENEVLKKYGLTRDNFGFNELFKWADERGFGVDENGRFYNPNKTIFGRDTGNKTYPTSEEERDLFILSQIASRVHHLALAQKHPNAFRAYSMVTAPIRELAATVGNIQNSFNAAIGKPIDVHSPALGYVGDIQAGRQLVSDEYASKWFGGKELPIVGNVGRFLNDTMMSLGDSVMTAAVGNMFGAGASTVTSFLMGNEAAASSVIYNKERGMSDKDALVLGLLSGAVEMLSEKIAFDEILKKPKTLVTGIIKDFTAEGLGEMAAEAGNVAIDTAFAGDNAEIRMAIKEYMAKGMTQKEATIAALRDSLNGVLSAGIAGGISGGIMGGAYRGMNDAMLSDVGSEIISSGKINTVIEEGLSRSAESDVRKTAEAIQKKINDGEQVTPLEVGRLAADVVATRNVAQKDENDENADEQAYIEETTPLDLNSRAMDVPTEQNDSLAKAAIDVVNARNKVQTDGNVIEAISRNKTPTYEALEALSQNNEPIAVADVKKATGFGDNGAKLVAELASKEGMTFLKARDKMKVAYLLGYNGEDITFADDLQNRAKLAGIDDRIADNNIALENAKNATVYNGVFTENEYTKDWSEATKKLVSTIAKHFGMDIAAVDKIIANEATQAEANAYHSDGKMRISKNRTAEKLIHALIVHESGHRMEQMATAEWNALADFVYKRAERLGRRAELGFSPGMEFDSVKAEHDNAGVPLSTRGYINEIVVRELETIFGSAEELNKFIAELESNQQAKSGFQKIMDFILELIEDVKRFIAESKMSKEERVEARRELAELEHIKELYGKAYMATKDAVAERGKAKTNSAKSLEIKTNKEYNGDDSYSLKKNTSYNEYNTAGMQWAYHPSTKVGDRKMLYNARTYEYVLVEATKEDIGFIEIRTGNYSQAREDVEIYESKKQRDVDRKTHRFENGQNDNARNNVNAGNRRTGKQNAELSENESDSYGTDDSQTSDRDLSQKKFSFQAKLTSNENPTSNPDIQFSLKQSVEETKNLIAVHNTTAEKLLGALKLGGLPSPSIAITKKDVSHEKFGDISLVFRKDSISPTDRRNKIYSGDAYTPTGVRVEYDVDDDVVQAFNKRLKELTPELENERLPSVDAGTATAENDSLYGAYERNDRAKLAFLREKGKDPKVAMRTPRLSYFVSNDTVIALAKAFSAKQLSDIANTSEGLNQYKNAFLKVIRDTEDIRHVESGIYSAEEASSFDIAETAREAAKVKENKYKIKKEVDNRKTYELIDKKFTKALKAEYRAWIDENTKDAIVDKGIRNNRDLFTPSGNRRSFKQLHEPYNLSNIVKQMFSGEDKGIALFGGSPIGAAQHEYSSIADVKEDSGRLQQLEQEEYDKIRNEIEGDVLELAKKMQIRSDVFAVRDLLSEAIGKKTKQQADAHLKREAQGWANYSPEFTDELWDIRERILKMPTEYFEAKPQRAVNFNEVALAVLPKGMTELRKQLENAGVQKVVYYNKGIEGDRLKKVNSVPDVNFSLKENNSISSKDRRELLDIIEHLKSEFELTKFAKADPKKLAKMTRDLLKEYSSQADFDETYKAIDELYTYMANGKDGHNPVWEEVYDRAYRIAQGIAENALVVDNYAYQEYKHLRDYLRTTPMKFNPDYDSVPSSYENFNEFRKMNMGRLKFTKDGASIDSVYQELAEMYPEFFDAEEQTNTADQLERIIDVLDELQPTEINPFDREIEQASMYLANDITSRFFDIPQAKPTFADKAERRVIEANIKGRKKLDALREQKDAKIKKLLETQKEKTKKQLDKLREQRDAKVKKEQEKRRNAISKMSENQKAKVLRARIMRHTSDLSKKLVNPTDNQHIPHELQGAVAKLLECINLESNYTYDTESDSYKKNDEGLPTRRTQAFNELKKVYADIASSVVVDPDLLGEYGLLSGVISLADKRIVDMTSSELDTVWQAIRAIEASVSTANRLFSEGKFATILEVAEALRTSNDGKTSKTEFKGIVGKGTKLATLDMLTPETYLHFLGDAGDSVFRMMRNAQDKHISIMKEVSDFTHKAIKDVDVNSLEKTLHTVTLGGEDIQLSTAQLMELYVLMKRDQAVEHIMVGGILPDVTESKGIKLITQAKPTRNISIAEVSAAISNLTDEQKKIADKLQKYASTVLSTYGNEASMQVYNYEKFHEEHYWPIRTNRQEIQSDVDKDTSVTTVANKGMTKATKPHANTSVRIGSIFDTFSSHASDMATYAAWLGTSEDVNRIRNFVFWEDGARTGTVKGIIDTVHGRQGSQYFEKLLTDVAIGVKGTDNMNPLDKFVGNYKAASVGANLRVIIQQPTAILRALDMIDARYLTEGTVRPLKGWGKAKKYAPIAQWKDWGYFDINTGRQMKDVLFDNASLLEKTKQVGMWGASMADSLAWGHLWNAVEAETKSKRKELEVGTDAYYKAVATRFTEIVDHTQVVDGILQRSQIMRSADNLTKMATSFMGEPTKQYNMAMSAFYDFKTGRGDARKSAAVKLGRTALALATAGIINACAQSIIDAMRDDDKEKKYWERWLRAFAGDGDEAKWYDTNLADTANPLNYIPFAKDIVSIVRGYDVKRMDTEAITKVFDATKNMYKSVTGEGKYTIAEASAQLFAEISRLYGVPVANVKRDVKSLVTSVAIETDSYVMQYRMEKAMLNINYAGNSKNFTDILFNAYINDREAYEVIYNDMLKNGFDADKIKNGMESRMKKAEGVEEVTELSKRYMSPDIEKVYDAGIKRAESNKVWKLASNEQIQEAKNNLYSFLASPSDEQKAKREEAMTYDVDETDIILWELASKMADDAGKDNDYVDAKEKKAALEMLDLGNSEIAYFYDTKTSAKAYENDIDMYRFAMFMGAISGIEGKGKTDKIKALAEEYAADYREKVFFVGSGLSDYKKKPDYIRYFGAE